MLGKFETDARTAQEQLDDAQQQIKQGKRAARLEQTKLLDDFEQRSRQLTELCRAKVWVGAFLALCLCTCVGNDGRLTRPPWRHGSWAQEEETDALRAQLLGLKEFAVQRDSVLHDLAATKARLEHVTAQHTRTVAAMRDKHADSRVRARGRDLPPACDRRGRPHPGFHFFPRSVGAGGRSSYRRTFSASSSSSPAPPTTRLPRALVVLCLAMEGYRGLGHRPGTCVRAPLPTLWSMVPSPRVVCACTARWTARAAPPLARRRGCVRSFGRATPRWRA